MAREIGQEPDHELATRKGDFALLLFSIGRATYLPSYVISNCFAVAVLAGSYLPTLARRDVRLLQIEEEPTQIQRRVKAWQEEALRRGKPLRLPKLPFTLRNIWSAAMLLFSVLTFSTFFVSTVTQVSFYSTLIHSSSNCL